MGKREILWRRGTNIYWAKVATLRSSTIILLNNRKMTPAEKAKELINKFQDTIWESGNTISKPMIVSCALICVNEILDGYRKLLPSSRKYWEQVKEEIGNY